VVAHLAVQVDVDAGAAEAHEQVGVDAERRPEHRRVDRAVRSDSRGDRSPANHSASGRSPSRTPVRPGSSRPGSARSSQARSSSVASSTSSAPSQSAARSGHVPRRTQACGASLKCQTNGRWGSSRSTRAASGTARQFSRA
jgi:hypothetical protein